MGHRRSTRRHAHSQQIELPESRTNSSDSKIGGPQKTELLVPMFKKTEQCRTQ